MTRPDKHQSYLQIADTVKARATCPRRQVGCVLVDKHFHILATGYNGTAKGVAHCTDVPCEGANAPSGTGLDKCEAIHAEQNALLQCRDVMDIQYAYCTTLPCVHCMKLLMNTSVEAIYFDQPYPNAEKVYALAQQRGIALIHLPLTALTTA